MNLSQAKSQLEKIIALYKSMSADEKNISAIERDLMLSYIRSLYDSFLDTSAPPTETARQQTQARPIVVSPPPVQPKPVVVEIPPPPPVQPKPVVVETPPPPPPVQPKPVVVETPPPPPVQPKPVTVETSPTAPEPVRYQTPTPSVRSSGSAEIDALFEAPSDKELSDRLSNTAIGDLTKAFGLNDRLLMQNELFANNKAVFEEILKDLNNASSFESARGYLIDFAKRYSWTANPERQKHAKSFIKMVRRRFK
ncbi:MAG: hypothetical protein JNL70_13355 [Saprospiraceae bacterium]|nr:hypothetical protein [Saprospiraceae bacterium]